MEPRNHISEEPLVIAVVSQVGEEGDLRKASLGKCQFGLMGQAEAAPGLECQAGGACCYESNATRGDEMGGDEVGGPSPLKVLQAVGAMYVLIRDVLRLSAVTYYR